MEYSESQNKVKNKKSGCCTFNFPEIPAPWLLFIDFAFTFGTTIVYFADIVTDIITLRMYYMRGWYYAFAFSICFIVVPSFLLALMEYNFLKKIHGKSFKWKTIALPIVLNVPLQLTVVWYHCKLTYTYLKNWLDYVRGIERTKIMSTAQWYDPTTLERSRGASLSSLNELDSFQNAVSGNEVVDVSSSRVAPPRGNLSKSVGSLVEVDNVNSAKEKTNWWKRLTNEEWLSHLNKLKLSESMLESLPQLLINLYLIVRYADTAGIQYVSAVLSYLSLCGGLVRYDKTRKDNEADRWMVDRTLLHSRAFYTRLEWPQMLFISAYKGCFLAARILAFVYFTIYYSWYILIPITVHWGVLLAYLIYRWYPDMKKVSRQLRQGDYKYRVYMFLSNDFTSVLQTSLMGIFIHVRPYYSAFLDQPYCFMFWYYVAYVSENLILFLLPGILKVMNGEENQLLYLQYYPLLVTEVVLNVLACTLCATYYLAVHKMRAFTAHAYPTAAKILCCCCYSNNAGDDDDDYWLPTSDEYTVCKQAETSELFRLSVTQLKQFHQTYNTVVRNDRLRGRSVECFIDHNCRIFYAPRSKMKKISVMSYDDATIRPSLRRLNDSSDRQQTQDIAEDDALLEERMRRNREMNDQNYANDTNESNGSRHSLNHDSDRSTLLEEHENELNNEPTDTACSTNTEQLAQSAETNQDRPVRKPRVKSIRKDTRFYASASQNSHNNSLEENDGSSRLLNQDDGADDAASSAPSRLPRSKDTSSVSVKDRLEFCDVTTYSNISDSSENPPSSRAMKRKDENVRLPRRIDDASWSSCRSPRSCPAPKIIDDSTFRVSKRSTSAKSFKPRKGWEDGECLSSVVDPRDRDELNAPPRDKKKERSSSGRKINHGSGWEQTWI